MGVASATALTLYIWIFSTRLLLRALRCLWLRVFGFAWIRAILGGSGQRHYTFILMLTLRFWKVILQCLFLKLRSKSLQNLAMIALGHSHNSGVSHRFFWLSGHPLMSQIWTELIIHFTSVILLITFSSSAELTCFRFMFKECFDVPCVKVLCMITRKGLIYASYAFSTSIFASLRN